MQIFCIAHSPSSSFPIAFVHLPSLHHVCIFWHVIDLDLEWKAHKETISCFHLYLRGRISQWYRG